MGTDGLTSLAALEEPLSTAELIWVLREGAKALRSLHASGCAHGAVCPQNLLLDPRGHLVLCKDTLAPATLSPEQQRGQPPEPRSDIFALGITATQLAAEQAWLPEPLERLLATMTAERPEQRYRSASDVLVALEAVELMVRGAAYPPGGEARAMRSRRQVLCVSVLVLSALMLALALLVVFGRTPGREGKEPDTHGELRGLLDRLVPAEPEREAPDGR
ncbi:MAG: hypothetical protein ACLF0G_16525 [Candidatus Brocadiia bacterium]